MQNGKYAYHGRYYSGAYVSGILDIPIIDTLHDIEYTIPAKHDRIERVGCFTNNKCVIVEKKRLYEKVICMENILKMEIL